MTTYETAEKVLKEHQTLVDAVKYGLRTLKSAKEINRRRTIQTILDRAQALRAHEQSLREMLDGLVATCEEQVRIDGPAKAPDGTPYATPLAELGLSNRVLNAFRTSGIVTLGDLAGLDSLWEVLKLKNLGKVSIGQVEDLLNRAGIVL